MEIIDKYKLDKIMFTDGSLKDGVVGSGIVDGATKTSYRLPVQFSVFSAEAYAIWKCLENTPNDGRRLVVLSDSLSVLAAVESGFSKHPWIQRIEVAMQIRSAVLVWIPGHSGIIGNVLADEAAKEANQLEPLDILLPKQDILRWAREMIWIAWNEKWAGCQEIALRRVKCTIIAGKDRKNQQEQRALTRLRIGHTHLTHGEVL